MEKDNPAPTSPENPTGPTDKFPTSSRPDYTMGMLCHLLSLTALLGVPLGNIIVPLIIWLAKRDSDPFVDTCGKESLNFQISVMLYGLALFALSFPLAAIPVLNLILIPLLMLAAFALAIAVIVLVILASIKASEGTVYRYPYNLRFFK